MINKNSLSQINEPSLRQLPLVKSRIKVDELLTSQENKSSARKCAALVILFLLTGAAAGYLIATTGAPSVNPLLFWGGVGFGGISLSMLLSLVVIAVNARKSKNHRNKNFQEYLNEFKTAKSIYDAMIQPQATKEAVEGIVKELTSENYRTIFEYASIQIFHEQKGQNLTAEQKQLMKVFASDEKFKEQTSCVDVILFLIAFDNPEGDQVDVNTIISRQPDEKYPRLVDQAVALLDPKPTMVLKALAGSDRISQLTSEQQRKLMEKVTEDEAKEIVNKLSEDNYKALAANVLAAYANDLPRGSQRVLTALAGSAYTSQLTPEQQRKLMEKVTEDEAKEIVNKLSEDNYKALATNVLAAYANDLPRGSQRVLTALAGSAYTSQLTPEQQRKLMEKVTEDEAKEIVNRLNQDQYNELVNHVCLAYFTENKEQQVAKNDKVVSALLFAFAKAASLKNNEHLILLIENGDLLKAKSVIESMSLDRFAEFAAYMNQVYYTSSTREINQNIEKAICQHLLIQSETFLDANLEAYQSIVARNIENATEIFVNDIKPSAKAGVPLRKLIIDNEKVAGRYHAALKILERLGDNAFGLICDLDKNFKTGMTRSHKRYESMLKLLVEEVSENTNVLDLRKKLYKQFHNAPQRRECEISDITDFQKKIAQFNKIVEQN